MKDRRTHKWCADTCPRQKTSDPRDCNCGGWDREAAMVQAFMFRPACHHPTPEEDR